MCAGSSLKQGKGVREGEDGGCFGGRREGAGGSCCLIACPCSGKPEARPPKG